MLSLICSFIVLSLMVVPTFPHSLRQTGKTCSVDGKVVNDGDTFTLNLAGPCVQFKCIDGGIFPGSYGCERDGACHPLGDTYNVGCIKRKCGPVNGNFGYTRIDEGCTFKDVCLKVNETYTEGCFTYKCVKGGSAFSLSYSVELVDWGCLNGGKCYKENSTLEVQCRTMKCERKGGLVGFVNIAQGCQFGSDCLKVGEQRVDQCRTFECRQQVINGLPYYSTDPVGIKCQDSNLDCKDPGSYFSFNMGGQVRQNCTCHVEGFNVQYFC